MMKNQKGITLIALVITIIVLLILAGVSIAMLRGDNGVLTNASEAQKSTAEKQAIEEINIALNSIKTEVLAQRAKDQTYDPTKHLTELEAAGITGITAEETEYQVTNEGNKTIKITYTNEAFGMTVIGSIDVSGKNGGTITAAKTAAKATP